MKITFATYDMDSGYVIARTTTGDISLIDCCSIEAKYLQRSRRLRGTDRGGQPGSIPEICYRSSFPGILIPIPAIRPGFSFNTKFQH